MVPSRMAGGMAQSSSGSGIFFQGERQPQGNSQLSSDFGNITNSIPGHARANMGPLYADMLNSVPSSGPSIGGSSLVTDANSGLSAGPHLQRSASINNESYIRLPASPLSFSSNNLSISGSSIIDAHQNSIQEHGSQQSQHQRVPNSFFQDMGPMSQLQKKPRLEINQEDVLQQLLQRQDSMNLQSSNPQLQALIQQQRLRQQNQQQQQLLQSMPPMQRIQLLQQQQQHQQQIKQQQQLLQQGLQPASGLKRPYDSGVCSRRLMQYLYHQRPRPSENTIVYWRKFVSEYYSPRAKKRWCLSRYDNVGRHSLGVFPQAAMDAWQCDICGSKSGRGFEATFEVLPRLNEIKFSSGVIDELLFLDLPREFRFPSGVMVLEYAKAVQESVYEQLRVVREGQLRIIFSPDLKIISWEFCARHHEELLPRRLVAPQVNQLLQVAQKCQSTISESGSGGVSQPEMQANGVMVVTAGLQLARSLELQSLNDLGFSKRYVRCLQIAEVVNFMKDLMDFCKDQKFGPMDGLKKFLQQSTGPKTQIQKGSETEMGGLQGSTTDQNMLNNKPLALPSVPNSPMNNNQHVGGQGPSNGTAQGVVVLSNYQNLLTRQNSMNSNHSSLGFSSPFGTSSQPPQTSQVQQQNQSLLPQGSSQASLQQQMMQQLLQDMSNKNNNNNNNGGLVQQQSTSGQNSGNSVSRDGLGLRSSTVNNNNNAAGNGTGNVVGHAPNRSNSFKAASNGGTPVPGENVVFGHKAPGLPHTSDEMDQDIAQDFMEYGFFNNDLDDNMNFSWKV